MTSEEKNKIIYDLNKGLILMAYRNEYIMKLICRNPLDILQTSYAILNCDNARNMLMAYHSCNDINGKLLLLEGLIRMVGYENRTSKKEREM